MKASTLSLTLVALASIGCQQAIPVEGTASHLVCSLDDCSNWETDLVQEEIADYRLHHVELFNTDFVEPTMIHVDSWLPCDPFAKIKVGQWTGEHTLLVRVMEANGNAGVPLAD